MDHSKHRAKPRKTCQLCRSEFEAAIVQWSSGNVRTFPWRRVGRTPYELVLAEVLLQQTRAEHVARTFAAILDRCPEWQSLTSIPLKELEDLLRPLGLYRRRARVLISLAEAVVQRGLPTEAEDLEGLPGIGQYMSRAIATQLSNEAVAPVDTNVARVLERAFGTRKFADIRYDKQLQRLALQLVPHADPDGYFVALVDFAAMICRSRSPKCDECPVPACTYRSANPGRSSTRGPEGL